MSNAKTIRDMGARIESGTNKKRSCGLLAMWDDQ